MVAGSAQMLIFAELGLLLGHLYLELGPSVMLLVIVPVVIAREMFASYMRVQEAHDETVALLIRALEQKDPYTAGHAERVAVYAGYIGDELDFMPARMERLRFAALMHDIGKLVVPNQLLNKPGKLTEDEFKRVRIHEGVSVQMLSHIDFLRPIAGHGHSDAMRFDPDDDDHLIEPYIIMVADAYDAMTSTRSYRKALPQEVAFQELRDKSGTQFHPACAEALIRAIEKRDEVHGAGPRGEVALRGCTRERRGLGRSGRSPLRRQGASMSLSRRLTFVAIAGLVAASAAHAVDPAGPSAALVLLAAGLVIGELLVLRLENGTAVPLSYAVLLVLASAFSAPRYATAVAGAELICVLLGLSDRSAEWRIQTMVQRILVAAATIAVYDAVRTLTHHDETVTAVLLTLGVAAVVQLPVDLAARWALRLRPTFSARTRLAWCAIASSGMLMAIGYSGVGGRGRVGIFGPLVFATPLLAAWYAFERLDTATRAYRQTIEALAMAPEFGGLVPPGHSQRVAALSSAMAGVLGVSAKDTADLEMAALLHHLGQVTIDEPEDHAHGIQPAEVAAVTCTMLHEIKPLAAAGDIVGGDASSTAPPGGGAGAANRE